MTITEESRYQLYKKLESTLGPDDTNTLMEHLPPVGWADVATKADLAHLQAMTQAEFATLEAKIGAEFVRSRGELDGLRREFGGLRGEFGGLRGEFDGLRAEFDGLRRETATGFDQVRADLQGLEERTNLRTDKTIAEALHRQFVQTIASVAAMFAVWSALAVIVGQVLVR